MHVELCTRNLQSCSQHNSASKSHLTFRCVPFGMTAKSGLSRRGKTNKKYDRQRPLSERTAKWTYFDHAERPFARNAKSDMHREKAMHKQRTLTTTITIKECIHFYRDNIRECVKCPLGRRRS